MSLIQVSDLLNMAIKDEETGIAFYSVLSQNTRNERVKIAFLDIAQQEQMHRDRFQEMLKSVGDFKPREEYAGQYEDYLDALLTDRAFPTPEAAAEKARVLNDDKAAVQMAIQMEKATCLFLESVKTYLDEKATPYIQEVVSEERQHLVDLMALKDTL